MNTLSVHLSLNTTYIQYKQRHLGKCFFSEGKTLGVINAGSLSRLIESCVCKFLLSTLVQAAIEHTLGSKQSKQEVTCLKSLLFNLRHRVKIENYIQRFFISALVVVLLNIFMVVWLVTLLDVWLVTLVVVWLVQT